MRTATWRVLSLLALLALFAGASCSNRFKLAEVKGRVTLKGKPLPKVLVEFIPDAANGPRASGATDENGQYTLVCDDKRPGAVVGMNRVVLRDMQVFGDKFLGRKMEFMGTKGGPSMKPSRIPGQYSEVANTPLKTEVKSQPNTIDLDVTGP